MPGAQGGAVEITQANYEQMRYSADIILINFYADWCRFSQMLQPIFNKAADILNEEEPKRVLLGRVNCEHNKDLCTSPFHITKYPTIKLLRHGTLAKREYRGQRSADAIVDYVRQQISDPVHQIKEYTDLKMNEVKKAIVGFFPTNESNEYLFFSKAAIILRDDCPFYSIVANNRGPQLAFREEGVSDIVYTGNMSDFTNVVIWLHDRCVPFVREITFQNGEELTEEGLPLLLLFYHPDRPQIKELFRDKVEADIGSHKGTVNVVTANGVMFAHPLHHLGKHVNDLPVIAIDSFRHMYLFPNFEDLSVPGKIHQFITDLHSGKLHRDFHNPTQPPQTGTEAPHQQQRRNVDGSPPESEFKKLAPGRSRYSFRDEL